MPGKSFFIDTSLCTACKGCQVACKQWHDLPAEKTVNRGTYQNPADLSFVTYKLVRFNETVVDGKLKWLFFPDQCRHCLEPPCEMTAEDPRAIFRDPATGAVLFTAYSKDIDTQEVIEACPYNIPRTARDGTLAKCDMCNDRVRNGLLPACVKTCPAGAMNFGDRDEILVMAKNRLATVKKTCPKAKLLDPDDVRVIYLVTEDPMLYHSFAVASNSAFDISRKVALNKLLRPLTRLTAGL
ncbi:MAG: formate dehydrogenase [Deltaproteobacteria bacterium]|jgi:formate dehydrogenase iron-sulfur subunit|nr:formate dehydrogenase [Deltaproteobacteria bacterium]MDL1986965.1 formate dehydrogenase [Deltaproteobacteria bacterium]